MCFSNISTKNKNKSFITITDRFLQVKNYHTIIDKESKFCSTQCIETFREKSLLKFKLINKPPKIDFRLLAHSFQVIHQQSNLMKKLQNEILKLSKPKKQIRRHLFKNNKVKNVDNELLMNELNKIKSKTKRSTINIENMNNEQYVRWTGHTIEQIAELCNIGDHSISHHTVFIFLAKFYHNISNKILAITFGFSRNTISKIFENSIDYFMDYLVPFELISGKPSDFSTWNREKIKAETPLYFYETYSNPTVLPQEEKVNDFINQLHPNYTPLQLRCVDQFYRNYPE
jgi:hypothetical protein